MYKKTGRISEGVRQKFIVKVDHVDLAGGGVSPIQNPVEGYHCFDMVSGGGQPDDRRISILEEGGQ